MNTISQYFTPSRPNKRPHISPDNSTSAKMTDSDQLLSKIQAMFDDQTKTLEKQISDLKLELKVKEEETSKKIESVQDEIRDLRHDNVNLRREIEDMRDRMCRNNLIFRGLKEGPRESQDKCSKLLGDFLKHELGCSEVFLNRAHRLGKVRPGFDRPVIAHIPNDYDIKQIQASTNRLKGTKYSVSEDVCKRVREIKSAFLHIRREAKKVQIPVKVTYDHMFVNDRYYSVGENWTLECEKKNGIPVLSEALGMDAQKVWLEAVSIGKGEKKRDYTQYRQATRSESGNEYNRNFPAISERDRRSTLGDFFPNGESNVNNHESDTNNEDMR
jgi:hypothetical protein